MHNSYHEGYNAGLADADMLHNPYHPGDLQARLWEQGWHNAQATMNDDTEVDFTAGVIVTLFIFLAIIGLTIWSLT